MQKDIINKCIYHHERGREINESETIDSDLHKYAKWTVKTAAIAAAATINPIEALPQLVGHSEE